MEIEIVRRAKKTLICGITAIICISIAGGASAGTSRIDAPPGGVELGLGWNEISASLVRNRCIAFAPIQEGGQQATLSLSEVSDSEELRTQLGVSVSASIHGIGATASASAEFAENAEVKTSSTNFVVRAAITNGVMFAGPHRPPAPRRYAFSATEILQFPFGIEKPEEPSREADTIRILKWVLEELGDVPTGENLNEKDKEERRILYEKFVKLCGTDFVSAIYSGVEMFTILSISTTDEKSKNEVKANVSASYGVGAGDGGFSENSEKNLIKSNTKMSFFQRGGAGGILPSSREKILQKLDSIAREAIDSPKFFDMEITSYADLPNWPFGSTDNKGVKDNKAIVVRRYYQLKTFYRDLQAVIDNLRAQESDPGGEKRSSDTNLPVPVNYDRCYSAVYYEDMQDEVSKLLRSIEDAQKEVSASNWDYTKFNADKNSSFWSSLSVGDDALQFLKVDEKGSFLNRLEALSVADLKSQLPPLLIGGEPQSQCKGEFIEEHHNEYQKRVMDLYIRPANVRTCERNMTDIDCLSNNDLSRVEQSIPYPSPLEEVEIKAGAKGYLCSVLDQFPRQQCVSRQRNKSGNYLLTADKSHAALITVEKGPEGVKKKPTLLLRVESRDPKGEATGMRIGKPQVKSGKKFVKYTNETKDNEFEIGWEVVKRTDSGRGVRLLDITESHDRNCLLNRRNGLLLNYPNECKMGRHKNDPHSDAYAWILIKEGSYEE